MRKEGRSRILFVFVTTTKQSISFIIFLLLFPICVLFAVQCVKYNRSSALHWMNENRRKYECINSSSRKKSYHPLDVLFSLLILLPLHSFWFYCQAWAKKKGFYYQQIALGNARLDLSNRIVSPRNIILSFVVCASILI